MAVAGIESKDDNGSALDSPSLNGFRLMKFQQLRKQHNSARDHNYTIMLTGSDKTNIFINGPDTFLDEMVKKLPDYLGKSWSEINNIRLGAGYLDS